MKSSIIAGLVAGFAAGIVMFLFNISGLYELFSVLPQVFPVGTQTLALYNIIFYIVWGIIWSALYAFFYDYLPAKGVRKGLIYGLIIWIVAAMHDAGTSAMYGFYAWAIPYALAAFFSIVIAYGLLIGALYRKPGD
jgi:hypothetical protein